MREIILGVVLGLIFIIGVVTGVIYIVEGFTPMAQRLCILGTIVGVVGWVVAETLE